MTKSTTPSFAATRIKAKCLDIFDQLAAHRFKRVTVTKRGRIVAILTPPEDDEASASQLYGCMRGTVVMPAGFDPTAPVREEAILADTDVVHE